jgi:hypothetical protein
VYLCNNAVNSSDYVVLNDRTISESERVWNNVVMASFEVLSCHWMGVIKGQLQKCQSRRMASKIRYEPRTSEHKQFTKLTLTTGMKKNMKTVMATVSV